MTGSTDQHDAHGAAYDPELAARRATEEEAANARATQLLKRIGLAALLILAFWVAVVLYGFSS